jgi:ParB/RepB/Spo0J family partition protein
VDLEFQQLDRRYERLRKTNPDREKRLLASLAQIDQQAPVIVIAGGEAGRYILLDGYKRVRALARLGRDTVRATSWDLPEPDALVLERLLRSADTDSPLEQGWLLRELRDRFSLTLEELGQRFDKSPSWVSGRLALIGELPEPIQEQVRRGEIVAHAAMRFFVPLARANRDDCLALAQAIAPLRPSTRQTEALCVAFQSGSAATRELVLCNPALVLRAREERRRPDVPGKSPAATLLEDFGAVAAIARRALRHVRGGIVQRLAPTERDEVARCFEQARADAQQLFLALEKELCHA